MMNEKQSIDPKGLTFAPLVLILLLRHPRRLPKNRVKSKKDEDEAFGSIFPNWILAWHAGRALH